MDQETNKLAEQNTFPTATAQKSPLAMILGVVGFIIILLGVGWYMMGMQTSSPQEQTAVPPTSATEDTAVTALSAQGSSDDVNAIDADIKASDISSLSDINKI